MNFWWGELAAKLGAIEHAYMSFGKQPFVKGINNAAGTTGVGVSGGYAGWFPIEEEHFDPIKCQPCRLRNNDIKDEIIEYGKAKNKLCCQCTIEDAIDCVKNSPLSKDYSANPFGKNYYVCYMWSDEALKKCCMERFGKYYYAKDYK